MSSATDSSYLNPRHQGVAGLGAAIAYFTRCGYPVFIPISECQRYDLVVEMDGTLKRIEVKTSTGKNRNGKWPLVWVRTSGKNSNSIAYQKLDWNSIDFLFVHVIGGDQYLIPSHPGLPESAMTLGENYNQFII